MREHPFPDPLCPGAYRPPTLHSREASEEVTRRALALAGRALWCALENIPSAAAEAHVTEGLPADPGVLRIARDYLAYVRLTPSSAAQTQALFVVEKLARDAVQPRRSLRVAGVGGRAVGTARSLGRALARRTSAPEQPTLEEQVRRWAASHDGG